MELPGKKSKWTQNREWRRGRQTMSTSPWLRRFGSTDQPTVEKGGLWFITSICPTIADPQLIPATKEVTMASRRTATHPNTITSYSPNNASSQSFWELPFHMAEAKSVWAPMKKRTTKEFSQAPASLHNNRKYILSLFRLLSMTASGPAVPGLLWALTHLFFQRSAERYLMQCWT